MPADDIEQWATGRLLSTASRLVEHAWDAHLGRWGLNHAGFAVLWLLTAGPATQRELARRMQVQDQTMSRTVERLERAHHIVRTRDAGDRRRVLVHVTDSGREAVAGAGDPAFAEELISGSVPPDEVPVLRRHLVALVRRHAADRWEVRPGPRAPDDPPRT